PISAKVTQDATTDSAKAGFDIEWLPLGTADNARIEQWIRDYDGILPEDYVEGETNYISDDEVQDWVDGLSTDAVAFLETLRAAEAIGATVEFNKMEGINI